MDVPLFFSNRTLTARSPDAQLWILYVGRLGESGPDKVSYFYYQSI